MTGCRHNAKNTLVKNYLYFAEKLGVEIKESTTVTEITKDSDNGILKFGNLLAGYLLAKQLLRTK